MGGVRLRPDGVLLGSEPKAILANPLARKAVDSDGVRELFAMTKAPRTSIWKGMYEVAPGTLIRVDRNGIHERTYWRLEAAEHTDTREKSVEHVRWDADGRFGISVVGSVAHLGGSLDSASSPGQWAENGDSYQSDFDSATAVSVEFGERVSSSCGRSV